jgi:HEAT repeat protein/lysophospholipase L1-like esterase
VLLGRHAPGAHLRCLDRRRDPVRPKPLLANLALSLGVSVGFLAGLEGLARLLEHRSATAAPVADYIWDWHDKMDGGDFYTIHSEAVGWPPWEEINADGLRDRTHPVERREGTYRLVVLGDSVTLGAGIKPDEAFPYVMEQRLRASGRRIEVMNIALWGWSTRQERIAYERIARRYTPDQVLLAICLNDIPELQNNLSRPPALVAKLHRRSALVRRLVNAPGREIQNVEQLFTDRESLRVREAFGRFFDEVRALRKEVTADGASFAMVVFPFRFQVVAGAPSPTVQREIEAFGEKENIPVLDVLGAVWPLGESGFVDYDHLSPAGAARVAEAIIAGRLLPLLPSDQELLKAGLGARDHDVATLTQTLASPDAQLRGAAAWRLADLGPHAAPAQAALVKSLGDSSALVRADAARALGAIGSPASAATTALFAALDDRAQAVRWEAALALSKLDLKAPEAVAPLAATLKNPDPYVRGFAAFSLGTLGSAARAAVPALIEALALDDGYGRGGASTALAKMGPDAASAVPALLKGLESSDGDRRWKAARTLGRIGRPAAAAIPALSLALKDPNEHVRLHAARALGRMGRLPVEAVSALEGAAKDADEDVRKEARESLGHGR